MKVPETISRLLIPFRKNAEVPQETPEQAATRRLEQIKKQVKELKEKDVGQPINVVKVQKPTVASGLDLKRFGPQQKAAIGNLLSRREGILAFMNSSDSTGTSRVKDAEEIAKIDARLQELGINPTDISSSQKAA